MYKLIETKKDILSFNIFEHYSITKFLEKDLAYLSVINLKTNNEILKINVGNQEGIFFITSGLLITALNNDTDLTCYNLETGKLLYKHLNTRVDRTSFKVDPSTAACVVYNFMKDEFYVMTLKTGDLKKTDFPEPGTSGLHILYSKYIISVSEREVLISNSELSSEHRIDVREIGAIKDHFLFGTQPGKIEDILLWQDSIFVLNGNSLQHFELSSGKLKHELKGEEEWFFNIISMHLYKDKILFLPRQGVEYRIYDIELNTLSALIPLQTPTLFSPEMDFVCTDWTFHRYALVRE